MLPENVIDGKNIERGWGKKATDDSKVRAAKFIDRRLVMWC